jgi:hypothetical protein
MIDPEPWRAEGVTKGGKRSAQRSRKTPSPPGNAGRSPSRADAWED